SASVPVRFYRASISTPQLEESCNVVGYVDMSIRAGSSMICNPLNMDGANHLSAILPHPPLNTSVSRWIDASQQYDTATFIQPPSRPNGPLPGYWTNDFTLSPGQGAVISAPSAFVRSFVGEVVKGYGVNAIATLDTIRSSIVPQGGRVTTDL